MKTVTENVAALVEARTLLNQGLTIIQPQLVDQSIPLEERWAAYCTLVKQNILVNEESYGDGHIDMLGDNMTMYDDFNVERRETLTYPDMYERIMEADEQFEERLVKAQYNIIPWQEKILASGYSGFCHDW
jgi:hypothetical protein